MRVSVLFLCYNHSAYVQKAIQSVFAQDYGPFELVVCEDCSKDNTRDLLEEELKKCPPHISVVRAYSLQNAGVKRCFNRCFDACSGDVAVHMSGDDISEPNRLRTLVSLFENNPRCALAFSDCLLIGPDDEILKPSAMTPQPAVLAYSATNKSVFASSHSCGASAAYRRDIHSVFGRLIPGHHPEDMGYWPRALMLGEVHFVQAPLVRWRAHYSNIFNNINKLVGDKASPKKPETQEELKNKWLAHTRMMQSFARQWMRDFNTAIAKNAPNHALIKEILRHTKTEYEMHRLLKYSIKRGSKKLWWQSAWRLFKLKWPRPCLNTWRYAWKIRQSNTCLTSYLELHRTPQ